MGGARCPSRIPLPFAVWLLQTALATVLVSSGETGERYVKAHHTGFGGAQHRASVLHECTCVRLLACGGGWTTGLRLDSSGRDPRFCLRLRGAGDAPPHSNKHPGVQSDAGARPGQRSYGPFQQPTPAAGTQAGKATPKMPIEYLVGEYLEKTKDPPEGMPLAAVSLEQRLARGVCDAKGVPPQISRASPWLPLHVAPGGVRLAGIGQRAMLIRAM